MNASIAAVPLSDAAPRAHRALERTFFAGMSVLMLVSVLFGFARTYFLAGMVNAPLPNRLIHVHGAVFSLWIVFLLVQTALVTSRQVRVHRALGMYGFGLAALMVVIGPIAAVDQLRRGHAPFGMDPGSFFIIPLTAVLAFGGFVFFAWKLRRNPVAHKRLILLATIALMDAAIGRWPVALLQAHPPLMGVVELGFVVLMAAFDLLTLRKIHRTTAIGFAVLAVMLFTRVPLAQTHAWLSFAGLFLHR